MSTKRRTLGVYSQKRPLGPNGEKSCYNCGGPLSPKGRPFNCSSACSEEWQCKTSPSYLRQVIFQRDHGVCALCGTDTEALGKQYRGLPRIFAPGNPPMLTFLIERTWGGDPIDPPFLVWGWMARRGPTYTPACHCQCDTVFEVSQESINEWWAVKRMSGQPPNIARQRQCLCSCNGRLIE